MNWITNSPPYGYGGRIADMIVFPERIIMSPTCSSRFFVGKKALSATARTTRISSREHHRTDEHNRPRVRRVRHRPVRIQLRTVACNRSEPSRGPCKLRRTLGGSARTGRRAATLVAVAGASALAATGCGGGEKQDAKEPSGSFPVKVERASFPQRQSLAKNSTMEIVVQNAGQKTIPMISVSVKCGTEIGGAVSAATQETSGGGPPGAPVVVHKPPAATAPRDPPPPPAPARG